MNKIEGLEVHVAADAFPMMDRGRFEELKNDILENGQRVPIILCEGKILDGRNRYKACQELCVVPKTEDYTGNPWEFVWSLNGCRRDLVDEQRYLVWKFCQEQSSDWAAEKLRIFNDANRKRSDAAKEQPRTENGFATKQVVDQNDPLPDRHATRKAKAKASKTGPSTVARGDALAASRPDLAKKVRKGEMKPAEAHRQMKRDAVAKKVSELPKDKYRVIYADPPWSYGDGRTGDHMTATGALDHYPTMKLSEICALKIPDLCADEAVLFLWATSPLLPDGLQVINAWGFEYKASFVWDKVKHNLGHYNSVRHEFLLVATKGSCLPDVSKLFDSVQSIERAEHSTKPEEFRTIIDTLYPSGKRIELFARKASDGWDRWGNES